MKVISSLGFWRSTTLNTNFPEEPLNLVAFCHNEATDTFDGDGRFPPIIIIISVGQGLSHVLLGCYDCTQCIKCKDRAQELLNKAVAQFQDGEKLAEWLKAAQPGAECASLCGDCLKEFILSAKWAVSGVIVKYGIKFVGGWKSPLN